MSRRRFVPLLALIAAAIVVVLLWPRHEAAPPDDRRPGKADAIAAAPPAPTVNDAARPAVAADQDSDAAPLARDLNAPQATVARDLDVLSRILDAWRSNFPHEGNPVGENSEITAALTGANPLQLVLIPKHHPAINRAGELCDRWGTPYRFHQISGQRMEIRSAGPDRKFATPDDAIWEPAL